MIDEIKAVEFDKYLGGQFLLINCLGERQGEIKNFLFKDAKIILEAEWSCVIIDGKWILSDFRNKCEFGVNNNTSCEKQGDALILFFPCVGEELIAVPSTCKYCMKKPQ